MIILIGPDGLDNTLLKIIECFEFIKFKDYIKINQDDLFNKKMCLDLNNLKIKLGDITIDLNESCSVFIWKYQQKNDFIGVDNTHVTNALKTESAEIYNNVIDVLLTQKTINSFKSSMVSKFAQLLAAKNSGLTIPATYLTNNKKELSKIRLEQKSVITKCFESYNLRENLKNYFNYTVQITPNDIRLISNFFFPSVIQKHIIKEFEIRTIYFYGKCYSVAIFSQKNDKTLIDYRNYDIENPNERVRYQLPKVIETRIKKTMGKLNLNFGSIDLIKTINNEYVFLEVNTMGQFESIANVYNLNIHMMIANKLINLSRNE